MRKTSKFHCATIHVDLELFVLLNFYMTSREFCRNSMSVTADSAPLQ